MILTLSATVSAQACGGGMPSFPPWNLDHAEYRDEYPLPGAQNELPFLSPGNDTRTNLQLLMMTYSPWTVSPINSFKLDKVGEYNEITSKFEYKLSHYLFEPALFTLTELGDDLCKYPKDHNIRNNLFNSTNEELPTNEASRCNSFKNGAALFIQSVSSNLELKGNEKELLIKERADMELKCDNSNARFIDPRAYLNGINAPTQAALDYSTYLSAAKSFYDGNFDFSADQFRKLNQSLIPWIRETSIYMIARVNLNKAQTNSFKALNGTPKPTNIDFLALEEAEREFNHYLSTYPTGLYAQSANGLLRRLSWLGGDIDKLSKQYSEALKSIGTSSQDINSSDLAEEIDRKLLNEEDTNIKEPIFIAVDLLKLMRYKNGNKSTITDEYISSKERFFTNDYNLYLFLKAARFYYVDKNIAATERVLNQIDRSDKKNGYITFSTDVLMGQSLMLRGNFKQAEKHWLKLLPIYSMPWQKQAIELGLAITWENQGLHSKIFDSTQVILSPKIRSIILRYVANAPLLHQSLSDPVATKDEKALATFTLLYKEATRGLYNDFLRDISRINLDGVIRTPTGDVKLSSFNWNGTAGAYECSSLKSTILELSKYAQSAHGLICLAEFIRLTQLDTFEIVKPKINELGGGRDYFPGSIYSRSAIYTKLITRKDISVTDKAYALYRAINCYSPTGINGCGGTAVSLSQRKNWYLLLKSKYGASPWSQELKFYW